MKRKLMVILSIAMLGGIPARTVQANLTDVDFRSFVVLDSAAACAINVRILNIIGNQLNGNEALLLNGELFTALTPQIIAQGLAAGQLLLFASPGFESEAGITADVPIGDQQCEALQAGDDFTFRGSESTLVSSQPLVVSALAVLTAIVLNNASNEYGVFALEQYYLTVYSLVASATVGNVNGDSAEGYGGGGCRLQGDFDHAKGFGWLLTVMIPLAGTALWRRRFY